MSTEAVQSGRSVVTERLTAESWSPFGWLPVADTDPADGEHRMAFDWADAHVNVIGHARTEVPETAGGYRCEMLYRHDTHTQALMPLDVPGVIAVAPAGVEFTDSRDLDAVHAFRIEPLESLVLHKGTWHWGPFPIEGPEVRLFNVQGLRYAEDNRCMDLAAKGFAVDIDLAPA